MTLWPASPRICHFPLASGCAHPGWVASGGPGAAVSADGTRLVAISDRAWAAAETATNPRFYFDWATYKRFAELPDPENPWTPAISVMQGLHAALELYRFFWSELCDWYLELSKPVLQAAWQLPLRQVEIFGVTDDWVADMSGVGAQLVGTAGDRPHGQPRAAHPGYCAPLWCERLLPPRYGAPYRP